MCRLWVCESMVELADSELGIPVQKFDIKDTQHWRDFEGWFNEHYPNSPHKILEHYWSYLSIQSFPKAIVIDVAADQSPYADYIEYCHFNTEVWKQDLSYEDDGYKIIGGWAADIPEDFNGRVDVMTLHCSFEHFEGDEDMRFIQNCGRLLAKRGRVLIAPIYTWHEYRETAPQPSPNTGFGRFYSAEALAHRVLDQLDDGLVAHAENVFFEGEYRFRALVIEREM